MLTYAEYMLKYAERIGKSTSMEAPEWNQTFEFPIRRHEEEVGPARNGIL
jgi:hypothetical protein